MILTASHIRCMPLAAQPSTKCSMSSHRPFTAFAPSPVRHLRWNARSHSMRQRAVVAQGPSAEISYIMVKPDGVQRGVVGEIISRFERKGFKLVGLKLFQTPKELAEEHYKDLKERPFYPDLVNYIISGPVVCMAWEGNGVVKSARKLIGATNPLEAEPGTIRGDLAVQTGRNIVHGSDSVENGERENALWFKEGEVLTWDATMQPWLTE